MGTQLKALVCAFVEKKVEFYELDPMGIVWHGNYTHYFESARRVLFDKIGYNYVQMHQDGYAFPIVDLKVKYKRPVTLHLDITIQACLLEYENRLKIAYKIYKKGTKELMTQGQTVQVVVKVGAQNLEFVTPLNFRQKVEECLKV